MEKLRNLSLKKTFILYMVVSLTVTYFLSAVIMHQASYIQQTLWQKYVSETDEYPAPPPDTPLPGTSPSDALAPVSDADNFMYMTPRPIASIMSERDRYLSEVCDFFQTYTILLLSVIGTCIAVFLFYQNKLRIPIDELNMASRRIAEKDFDFHILYENRDELGQLCREFEQMREQLMQNNQILWKTVEEERALRAAIAHDIRSPLSVLKGYQEMLIEYVPSQTIGMDKIMEMLHAGMHQIERMDVFVETMRRLNSLGSRKIARREITAAELETDLRAEIGVLAGDKEILLEVLAQEAGFTGDKEMILEVAENILSNALRYADTQIRISVIMTRQELTICVTDDGCGFAEPPEKIQEPYFQQNIRDSLKHTGLGMYISRLYCEQHGGKLLLENDAQGGASVTAVFR